MDNETLLQEFREKISAEFSAKGVLPPEKDSAREQELFERWKKGKEALATLSQ